MCAKKYNVKVLSAELLQLAIAYGRTQGGEKIIADGLTNEQWACKLIEIYEQISK